MGPGADTAGCLQTNIIIRHYRSFGIQTVMHLLFHMNKKQVHDDLCGSLTSPAYDVYTRRMRKRKNEDRFPFRKDFERHKQH